MTGSSVECVIKVENQLGESPLWEGREGALYWVDIRAPALHRYDPAAGSLSRWPLPQLASCVVPRLRGGLLVALKAGVYPFNPIDGALGKRICAPEPERPANRLNDGKCDRRGRFWVGRMIDGGGEAMGALYRIEPDASCRRVIDRVSVPNAICWSPDDRTFYFADTRTDSILSYEFDIASGRLGGSQVFVGPGSAEGRPDGATVDEVGCIWSARYGGGAVVRFTPTGKVDRVIKLPVSQVTSCAFGGSKLSTLFITTARQRLTEAQLAEQPLAGALFAVEPGMCGLPEPGFAG
ncbi:MAG: SMP-30/gluconolactonase/LRE family protein [Proteobacteria bacterium]|nr:SMP-30/gluconolactonase/LRE family protein [Pseudomonadota bacterium]